MEADVNRMERFIDELYATGVQQLMRDDVLGRAEQHGLPKQDVHVFQDLPPGPYTQDELKQLVREWAAKTHT